MTSSFLKQATEGNKNAILKQQIICQYIFCGDSASRGRPADDGRISTA